MGRSGARIDRREFATARRPSARIERCRLEQYDLRAAQANRTAVTCGRKEF
jgi:hypothetical protein